MCLKRNATSRERKSKVRSKSVLTNQFSSFVTDATRHSAEIRPDITSCCLRRFFFVTGKASELYDAMLQLKLLHVTGHTGRETPEVGLRQQQRHLKDIRLIISSFLLREKSSLKSAVWQSRHLKPLITYL